jgi:hypothetical protein
MHERLQLDHDGVPECRVQRSGLLEQRAGLSGSALQRQLRGQQAQHYRQPVGLLVLPGDRRRTANRRLTVGEASPQDGAVTERGQPLHRHEAVAESVGGLDHTRRLCRHAGDVPA